MVEAINTRGAQVSLMLTRFALARVTEGASKFFGIPKLAISTLNFFTVRNRQLSGIPVPSIFTEYFFAHILSSSYSYCLVGSKLRILTLLANLKFITVFTTIRARCTLFSLFIKVLGSTTLHAEFGYSIQLVKRL